MEMSNVNEVEQEEGPNRVDDAMASEAKMVELMAQMQEQASNIPDVRTSNKEENIGLTIKPEEDNINYYDVDVIPTGYKLYPDGTAITARPLKVLEVKKLTALNDVNADKIVNDILRKSIRGVDVNDIFSADKMYLLLWLRANSFRDNRYVVDFKCDCCDKESTYHFDIDNVSIDFLGDDYDPNHVVTLPSGDRITLKLLQVKDELLLSDFNRKNRVMLEKTGVEIDDELLAISFMVDTINGAKLDSVATYNYLLEMGAGGFSVLTTELSKTNVGIKNSIDVVCNKCGGTSQLGITFHSEFVLPKYKA